MAILIPLVLMFMVLPAAIAFAVPRQYFGFLVAWFLMLVPVGASWPSGPDHSSPFAGTGDAIYALLCGLVGTGLAIRGLALLFRPQKAAGKASPLAWAVTGALAAICAMSFFSMQWSDIRPVWLVYAPALTILAGSLVLTAASIWIANARYRAFTWGLAASAIASFAWGADWTYGRVASVADAAERLAGDQSYCIQVVAKRSDFETATTRWGFSPLTMRAPCPVGWCWTNHAILVIENGDERRLMNWSHKRREFRDEVLNMKTKPPAVVCQPRSHFARDLPLLFP